MVNGHPTNENVFGSIDVDNTFAFDLKSLDRIEIVKGPGSALYGTGAMFGVVNLITHKGQSLASSTAQVAYGSNEKRRASLMYGHKLNNGIDLQISGVWGDIKGKDLYYGEYEIPDTSDGIARGLDWEKYYGFYCKVEYSDFTFQGLYTSRDKGIPTAPYGIVFNDPAAQTNDSRMFAGVEYNKDIFNDINLKLALYYDRYKYDGTFPYDSSEYFPSYVHTYDGSVGEWISAETQIRWDVSSKYFIVAGVEYRWNPQSSYFNKTIDTILFNRSSAFSMYSLYLHNEYQISPSISLMGALRFDYSSRTVSVLSPRIGCIITPTRTTTIKLLGGSSFRSPNFYELYYFDDPSGFIQSNNLRSEQIVTNEIIWEQRISDDLFGTFSLYRNRIFDLIDQVEDKIYQTETFKNISPVNASGLEISLQYYLKSGISGYINYSYQHAVEINTESFLTNSPEHLLKIGGSWRANNGFSVGSEFFYETQRITVHHTKTSSFLICNIFSSYRLWVDQFLIAIKVKNLFDQKFDLPAGFEHGPLKTIEQNGRIAEIQFRYVL